MHSSTHKYPLSFSWFIDKWFCFEKNLTLDNISKEFRFYSSLTFANLRVAAMVEGTCRRFSHQSPRSNIYPQCIAKAISGRV